MEHLGLILAEFGIIRPVFSLRERLAVLGPQGCVSSFELPPGHASNATGHRRDIATPLSLERSTWQIRKLTLVTLHVGSQVIPSYHAIDAACRTEGRNAVAGNTLKSRCFSSSGHKPALLLGSGPAQGFRLCSSNYGCAYRWERLQGKSHQNSCIEGFLHLLGLVLPS